MQDRNQIDRRRFLKGTAAGIGTAAAAGSILHAAEKEPRPTSPATQPAVDASKLIWRSKAPGMEYARLGRTNYMVSRIVAGIGGKEAMWRRMMALGMNYFDTASCYVGGNHETQLSKTFKANRDKLWITSKASDIAGFQKIDEEVRKLYLKAISDFLGDEKAIDPKSELLSVHEKAIEKAKQTGKKPDLRPAGARIAKLYLEELDRSLSKMTVDDVDCYMMHGIEIPWIFDCHELWQAYEKAHKAGKAKHFGFSVHKHHKAVLAASVEANERGPWRIDLIMPGVNAGSFDNLKPELAALKKQDVGIIAMKTRGIKNRPNDKREDRLKSLMGGKEYGDDEKNRLWMLHLTEGLIDAVIVAIETNELMEKSFALPSVKLSAKAERELRAIVRLTMAGTCTLCGRCDTNCPENIAVTDMIRYHAYVHQYDEKELARRLYQMAGYDPARLCSNCGTCMDICPAQLPITELLNELSADMA
jgi:predicted aldo/keto reductase-like oxidoreductase